VSPFHTRDEAILNQTTAPVQYDAFATDFEGVRVTALFNLVFFFLFTRFVYARPRLSSIAPAIVPIRAIMVQYCCRDNEMG
jgi:hypothetical protein